MADHELPGVAEWLAAMDPWRRLGYSSRLLLSRIAEGQRVGLRRGFELVGFATWTTSLENSGQLTLLAVDPSVRGNRSGDWLRQVVEHHCFERHPTLYALGFVDDPEGNAWLVERGYRAKAVMQEYGEPGVDIVIFRKQRSTGG